MNFAQLLQWQWKDYGLYHQHKANLLLHIVAVPLFLAGTLLLLAALFKLSAYLGLTALACIVASLAAQGRGHSMEPVPPVPFSSRGNAVARLLVEQWITFPRFVLSGGWYRNLARASDTLTPMEKK